jgi:hypothetical protein
MGLPENTPLRRLSYPAYGGRLLSNSEDIVVAIFVELNGIYKCNPYLAQKINS